MPKQINNDIESKFSQILKCTEWKSRDGIVQKGYTVRLLFDKRFTVWFTVIYILLVWGMLL